MYLFAFFLYISSYSPLVSSQSLAAWSTNIGDQVIYQNASSGDLLYTINTGSGTGAGGFTAWARLPVTTPPRAGSRLAGTGYAGSDGNLYGEIFYISQSGDIVEAEVLCPLTTGKCILQRSNVISSAVSSGVNSDTGLAATLRSDTDGYRVFYHDNAATIRQIRFQNPNITWGQGIPVTSDTNESLIGLTTDSGANLTAYGIDESGRIRSSILKSNETWQESNPIPVQQLLAWSPRNVTLAATAGSSNASKSLYYIGTDRLIHGLDTSNSWATITTAPAQDPGALVLADQPNAMFAATSSAGATSFYYISSDTHTLVKATLVNGVWQAPVSIFDKTSDLNSTNRSKTQRLRIGAGVGLGLGLPLAIGVGALGYVVLQRRRRRNASAGVLAPVMADTCKPTRPHTPGPPVPQKNPFEMQGREVVCYELGELGEDARSPAGKKLKEKSGVDWV